MNKRKGSGSVNGSEKQSETYELILIGGDSGEYGLREYEGLVRLLLEVHDRLCRARVRPLHQVDPRLILVHGVQHQLQIVPTYNTQSCVDRLAYNGGRDTRSQINARGTRVNARIFQIDTLLPTFAQGVRYLPCVNAGKRFKHSTFSVGIFIISNTSLTCCVSIVRVRACLCLICVCVRVCVSNVIQLVSVVSLEYTRNCWKIKLLRRFARFAYDTRYG